MQSIHHSKAEYRLFGFCTGKHAAKEVKYLQLALFFLYLFFFLNGENSSIFTLDFGIVLLLYHFFASLDPPQTDSFQNLLFILLPILQIATAHGSVLLG